MLTISPTNPKKNKQINKVSLKINKDSYYSNINNHFYIKINNKKNQDLKDEEE